MIFAALCSVLGFSCAEQWADENSPEVKAIGAAWAEYQDAVLNRSGAVTANRVTTSTLEYYDEVRKLAIYADQKQLEGMVLAKRITVLGMRHRIDVHQLSKMTGKELLIYAVDKGWIGKNNTSEVGLGKISITGNQASAVAMQGGKPSPLMIQFLKEDGVWRLDLMRLMALANAAFDQVCKQSGMPEQEFIKAMLENISGKKVTEELWKPLKKE